MELIAVMLTVLGCIALVLYATWLFGHRLRRGMRASKSFGQWLKHLSEAVWGL